MDSDTGELMWWEFERRHQAGEQRHTRCGGFKIGAEHSNTVQWICLSEKHRVFTQQDNNI